MDHSQPPSHGQPPPRPDPNRRRFVNALLVISAVVLLITYFANQETETDIASVNTEVTTPESPTPETPTASLAPAQPPTPVNAVGRPVRDGQFEFVVTSFDGSTAQITVTNIGDRPKTVDIGEQILVDIQGRQFAPSVSIMSDIYYETLNPGESVSGALTYELSGAVPNHLELHDSAFSEGVEVSLR
ncbi:DUF4352 domain-containing protein [Rhodococcus sp. 2H158]